MFLNQSIQWRNESLKRFLKCVCICVAIAMAFAVPVSAAGSDDTRASSYFIGSSVYLYKVAGTIFDICFDVTATGTMQTLGARTIKLQKSTDNANWTTVKTYSMDDYSNLVCSNTGFHGTSVRYTGVTGCYYRAIIDLYAKNSSGYGVMTRYTSSIKVP